MNLLQRVRQDVRFVRDAARAYSILLRVRADAEIYRRRPRRGAGPRGAPSARDPVRGPHAHLRRARGRANRVAHWASAQGIGRGDVVALLMENRPEFVATWAGLAKLGVITALLNTNLAASALAHALAVADAQAS